MSLEHSRTNSTKKKAKKNGSKSTKTNLKMTIDGTTVDPVSPVDPLSVNKSYLSVNKSVKFTVSTGDRSDADEDGNVSDNPSVDGDSDRNKESAKHEHHSQALEILAAMSKMTLLVIIAATGSFLTIVGNFIIESVGKFNEKDLRTDKGLDHDAIWVFILPAADMVITSFMLYLQFNFTHKMYKIMCHCLDSVFLRCMLWIIGYCWAKSDTDSHSFKPSAANTVELQTKSSTITPQTGSASKAVESEQETVSEIP